ncbi:efflux RND transporter permease subunit [Leucobacter luti]|uniref:HAE1 family hydrophobic/amphiphilic exporter-1 n=1 Tax=Leucobacter luti TaxID=340320 RepID=A0A4Q7U4C2_9MICO|nr:efflux RND transporter permease subunit [Leucobacter luti]MBL3700636.1 efflux RND transporter permease subunit [Leucobacter luti]RZT68525.1 HAE1 family hydrophobic/amphiphilic exporter-1 [Leucobacter luti]
MHQPTRFSLANRALIALVTIMIAAFGVFSMTQLKQELIPAIELPQVQVVTVIPGSSPEVIDEQVSEPLSRALRDLEDVESVVATSSSGVSSLAVAYAYGTDAKEFTASLTGAIDGLSGTLPADADPSVTSISSSSMPVMFLTAASSGQSLAELSTHLDDAVVPKLEAISGVRAATVSGAETQRVTITPDPAQLAVHGLSAQQISQVLEANGMTLPLGSVSGDGVLMPIQGGEAIESLDALRALPLASTTQPGTIVSLGDVADVAVVTEEQTSITRTNGVEALSIMISATADADIVSVSAGVTEALAELGDEFPSVELTVLFDQAPFIEESISALATEGMLGLLFAVIVILVFLLSVRSTLVTAISIPLSVLVTFIGLNLGGSSLNMLTLGALTIAIGRVVDDSIVVIENIKRHLSYGEPKERAILTGVREVAGAITSSTLATVAVFVPIALVGGMVGELFSPFALTVTIAMLSSLLVALTIVPVLSYWFLKQPTTRVDPELVRAEAEQREHAGWLQRMYKPVLRGTLKKPVTTLVASALLLVLTVGMLPLLKVDFLGSTGQNSLSVTQTFPDGSDLETVSDGAVAVEQALLDIEGIDDVMLTAGSGGGLMAMLGGSGEASYLITTDPDADQTELQNTVRAAVSELDAPGEIAVTDSAAMSGFGGAVDVLVTAPSEAVLATAASEVLEAVQGTPLATEIVSDLAPAQPIVTVVVDRAAALQQGLTEMQVLGLVANTVSPQSIGEIGLDGKDLKIYLAGTDAPATVAELDEILLPGAAGFTPLSAVATIAEVTVPAAITRNDGDLTATISLTPAEGELGAVTASVQDALDGLALTDGAAAELGGLATQQTESFEQLGLAMLVAIAIVFVLLVMTFRSLIQPLILLVSIPFAATGAIALLLISGRPLGISALIGMLMLIGIVVTNAIVLIDLINQYRRQGQSVADAVHNGARQRLRPILMTAIATIFALIPMAIGVTGSSGFISQDLAIVVIGGLISSTVLTLVVVPVLYSLVEGRRERRAAGREQRAVAGVPAGAEAE